jgi:glycosyltransferase involved in cell wall biosynthesis
LEKTESAVEKRTPVDSHSQWPGVDISVIIPSFNARRTVGAALRAIANQRTRQSYEVILVDSSSDGTSEYVTENFPEVKVIRLAKQTYPGIGRNIGVQNARGKFVVFTDTDCVPAPDWLDQILSTFESVKCEAVGGCLINGYPWSPVAWTSHLIEFNEWTETSAEGFVLNIPSANLAYRRAAFAEYDEWFPDYLGSEDSILNAKMRAKGVRIYFNPAIQVVHLNRGTFEKLFRHSYMLGRWSAEARKKGILPGGVLAKYRVLAFALPFARLFRGFSRLLRKDLPKLLIFIGISPLYLAAAFAWSFGFVSKKELKYSVQGEPEIVSISD